MILLLLSLSALALDDVVLHLSDLGPPPPDTGHAAFCAYDLEDVVVVRVVDDEELQWGVDIWEAVDAALAGLRGRETTYDMVILTHTTALPVQFDGAAAWHLTTNNVGVAGTGDDLEINPDIPVQAILWMNHLDYWVLAQSEVGAEYVDYVFVHEMGHQWLAYPWYDSLLGPMDELLGRQRAHWSYFAHTAGSPLEGNHWTDNGDGSFTTTPVADWVFPPLDLYLMGMAEAEEVPDFFLIDGAEGQGRVRESSPEHKYSDVPYTVEGVRVDLSVWDIIEAEGPRTPGPDASQRDFRLLTVLVLGPREELDSATLEVLADHQALWTAAWSAATGELSSVDFTVDSEGLEPPPLPITPALVPLGAR